MPCLTYVLGGMAAMLIRNSLLIGCVIIAAMMTGCCCGPYAGCGVGGVGGCVTDCNDCDGAHYRGDRYIAAGPLQHMAMLRKSFVCGGGCGEVYYGEWQSTPPDACDPCCGDQFVGGAVPCQPFCWQWRPGSLLFGFLNNFYGQRLCDVCGNSPATCGCGFFDNSCGACEESGCGHAQGGSDCSTCNSSSAAAPNARIANPKSLQTNHRTARANAIRGGFSSIPSNRTQYR